MPASSASLFAMRWSAVGPGRCCRLQVGPSMPGRLSLSIRCFVFYVLVCCGPWAVPKPALLGSRRAHCSGSGSAMLVPGAACLLD